MLLQSISIFGKNDPAISARTYSASNSLLPPRQQLILPYNEIRVVALTYCANGTELPRLFLLRCQPGSKHAAHAGGYCSLDRLRPKKWLLWCLGLGWVRVHSPKYNSDFATITELRITDFARHGVTVPLIRQSANDCWKISKFDNMDHRNFRTLKDDLVEMLNLLHAVDTR